MATYFDATDSDHKAMLPEPIRDADDLANVAAEAEYDVIEFYTRYGAETTDAVQVGTSDFYVHLYPWESDADDVDTTSYPYFVTDMRRTIADLVRWRFEQRRRELGVTGKSSDTGASRTFTEQFHHDRFPPNWNRRLEKYSGLQQPWSL